MPLTPFLIVMRTHSLHSVVGILGIVGVALLVTGCNGPRRIHEAPVLVTGDRVASIDSLIEASRAQRVASRLATQRAADSVAGAALRECAAPRCAVTARGEVTLGMTEPQLLAATGTTPDVWATSGPIDGTKVFRPGSQFVLRDARGTIASVSMRNGRVESISREERTGLHTVTSPADTGRAARARVFADALVQEGDDYIAAGDRVRALERYDRALVLREHDALLNYKVAQLLDQQLRPVEALMRYQKFLLQLELQRMDAQGTQNAKLAEAIALAQQRVLVLDRRPR